MEFILKMKHWQLFLFLFLLPFTILIAIIAYALKSFDLNTTFLSFSSLLLYFTFVILSWIKVTGIHLNEQVQSDLKINTRRLNSAIAFIFCYAFLISVTIVVAIYYGKNSHPTAAALIPLFLCHVFAMLCTFYCIYNIAKVLNAVEKQRICKWEDFWEDFLFIAIFPIGVWFIQPRINKIFNN